MLRLETAGSNFSLQALNARGEVLIAFLGDTLREPCVVIDERSAARLAGHILRGDAPGSRAHRPASPAHVLDHDSAEQALHLVGPGPANRIVHATWRKRNDQPDRTLGVFDLRRGPQRHHRRSRQRHQTEPQHLAPPHRLAPGFRHHAAILPHCVPAGATMIMRHETPGRRIHGCIT